MSVVRVNSGLGILLTALLAVPCQAADLPSRWEAPRPVEAITVAPLVPQSIMVFGGRMSTKSLSDTMTLNFTANGGPRHWDNYIVGGAYRREITPLWFGFVLGFEAGVADRFGHYRLCCVVEDKSSSLVHSVETWGGIYVRVPPLVLRDSIVIGAGLTAGLSLAPYAIGVEPEREQGRGGTADLLFYFSPEITLSLTQWPAAEVVLRVHHRSGMGGVLGGMHEGYNAIVLGTRYRL